jgi:hypothetical protein
VQGERDGTEASERSSKLFENGGRRSDNLTAGHSTKPTKINICADPDTSSLRAFFARLQPQCKTGQRSEHKASGGESKARVVFSRFTLRAKAMLSNAFLYSKPQKARLGKKAMARPSGGKRDRLPSVFAVALAFLLLFAGLAPSL